jgi:hypothetical protein
MLRAVLLGTLLLWPLVASSAGSAQAGDDAARQRAAAAPAPGDSRPPELAELIAEADAAYARRDQPGALDELRERLAAAERLAPDDFEVLWRLARLHFWVSDDPGIPKEQKSKVGKQGWDLAERAIAADPGRVEGYHFAAAGMGNYALGLGLMRALREGIEGKFKGRLSRAEQLDPDYQQGAIQTAWGRFWFELPWPKYDARKSERSLLAALKRNPDNVRAHVYLADLYRKEGHDREAREQLEQAAAGEPGRYDGPEERRWQEVARRKLGSQAREVAR